MKRLITMFVLVMIASAIIPEVAFAQLDPDTRARLYTGRLNSGRSSISSGVYVNTGRETYNRGIYYDPAQMLILQDFLKVPGILSACRLVISSRNSNKQAVTDCHVLSRSNPEALQAQIASFPDSDTLGTQHPEKGAMHFRAYDSTHNPFNRNHKDCILVEPSEVHQTADFEPAVPPTTSNRPITEARPVVETRQTPIQKRLFRNKYEYDAYVVRIRRGTEIIAELKPGEEITVDDPGTIWAEVYSQNNKNSRWEWTVIQEGRGMYKLPNNSGWEFSNPTTRPTT